MKKSIVALLCVCAFTACDNQRTQPVSEAKTCCQCPGIWKDPPTDPQTYRIAPDCQNNSPGVVECTALCKALGHSAGELVAGTCAAGRAGAGNTCK
jgi:hypothetical protein